MGERTIADFGQLNDIIRHAEFIVCNIKAITATAFLFEPRLVCRLACLDLIEEALEAHAQDTRTIEHVHRDGYL